MRDLDAMIAQLEPLLDETLYRFVLVTPDIAPQALGGALATIREREGVTAIVPTYLANELGAAGPDFARITLQVHSDLEGIGLTAVVSTSLAKANIACNVVAAYHHDHIFVPAAEAERALEVLEKLQHP